MVDVGSISASVELETKKFNESIKKSLEGLDKTKAAITAISEQKLELNKDDFEKATQAAQDMLQDVQKELDKLQAKGKETETHAKSWKDVTIPVLNKSIRTVDAELRTLAANPVFAVLTAAVATIAALTAGYHALAGAINEYNASQREYVLTGADAEGVERLQDLTHDIVMSTGMARGDITNIAAPLTSYVDATDDAFEDLVTTFNRLQKLTGEDTLEPTIKAMRAWGVATADITKEMDAFYKISQSSGMSVTALMSASQGLADTLKPMGATIDGTAQLLGNFNKLGLDSGVLTSSLRVAIQKMAESGKVDMQTFDDMISQIKNATDEDALVMSKEFFGRGGAQMVRAIKSGAFETTDADGRKQDVLTATVDAKDHIAETAGTASTAWDRLGNTMNKLSEAFEPFVKEFDEWLQPKLDDLNKMLDQMIPIINDDLLPILRDFLKIIDSLYTIAKTIADTVSGGLGWLGDATGIDPIGWLGGAVSSVADAAQGAANVVTNLANNTSVGGSTTNSTSIGGSTTNSTTYNINLTSSGNADEDLMRAEEYKNAAKWRNAQIS